MSEPSKLPGGSSDESSDDRQHLKFNQDVLPEFKRRPDSWEPKPKGAKTEVGADLETDSIVKWVGVGIILLIVAALVGITLRRGHNDDEEAGDGGPSAAE
jgi:hypothetical protein